MSESTPPQLKFAADRMLGRLAKWLRVLGQDVIYGRHLSGAGLIHAARQENRTILTRDRRLRFKQPQDVLFIESNQFRDQLLQVVNRFHLVRDQDLFRRCLTCNSRLQPRSKFSVKEVVPEYVFLTQDNFFWCAECHRIYWPATHHQNMLQELQKLGLE
jgi:uncharacterized protein with PIN domain